jgi:TolB-like protein/DNA-binding winged helix-turn-helix (wHTH) protein/thioredoxin-like negative regulator of GroEL
MENGNRRNKKIAFGDFEMESELEILRRGDAEVHLAKRPFSVLLFLIENRERIVSRNELLEKFWDGRDVYDDALRKCVGAIRKAIDDEEKPSRFIEIRRGSGYRFVGSIKEESRNGKKTGEKTNGSRRSAENAVDRDLPVKKGGEEATVDNRTFFFNFTNHSVLTGIFAVVFISFIALAFYSYRRDAKTGAPQTLTETVAAKRSIAILPLKNLTGDAANDYLSDGITESLINEISRIETVKVISRSSAFQFKNKDVSAQEIGEKLGVETILEGSLKQNGEDLRVEVRLVNSKDGSVMWTSDSEQKKLADIFAIQDGIACQIVAELKVKLCGEVPPSERYTQNVKAYQLYLQGMYYRNRLGAEDLKRAVGFFEQALQVDPNYALAHEGLAATYTVMEFNAIVPPGTVAPLAESHAIKALELDDSLAVAYLALGAVKTMKTYDLAERERYYRQALQKNPNHRTAHLWLANNFTVQGKFEEAEAEILRAQEIDPLSVGVRLTLAELYWYWQKPDKVIEQANLMLIANPDASGAFGLLARAYVQKGDFEKAFAVLKKIPSEGMMQAIVLAAAGRTGEARKFVEALADSDEAKNSPFKIACAYALLGDKEKTFAWLEKSYQMRQADLVSIKIDPALAFLRDDPRFQELLRRVHLAD